MDTAALMPPVAFLQFHGDKLDRITLDDILIKLCHELIEKVLLPGQKARFDKRCADGDIFTHGFQGLTQAARRMANSQPHVPEDIEQ